MYACYVENRLQGDRFTTDEITALVQGNNAMIKVDWIQVLVWAVVRICQILLYTLKQSWQDSLKDLL